MEFFAVMKVLYWKLDEKPVYNFIHNMHTVRIGFLADFNKIHTTYAHPLVDNCRLVRLRPGML